MKCDKCKREIPDDSNVCVYCGSVVYKEIFEKRASVQTESEENNKTPEEIMKISGGEEVNNLRENESLQTNDTSAEVTIEHSEVLQVQQTEERGENIRIDTLIKRYASSVYILVPTVCLSLYFVLGIFGDPPNPITVIFKFIGSFLGLSLGGLDYILEEVLNGGISLLFSGLRNFGRFVRLIEHIPGILIVGSLFSIYFSAKKSDRFKPINPTATALIYYVILLNGVFKCIAYIMALAGIVKLTSMFSDGISDIAGTAIFVVAVMVAIQVFFIGKLLQCVKVVDYTTKKQYDESGIPGFIIGYCLVTGILGILASVIGGMSVFVNALANVFFGLGLDACKNEIENRDVKNTNSIKYIIALLFGILICMKFSVPISLLPDNATLSPRSLLLNLFFCGLYLCIVLGIVLKKRILVIIPLILSVIEYIITMSSVWDVMIILQNVLLILFALKTNKYKNIWWIPMTLHIAFYMLYYQGFDVLISFIDVIKELIVTDILAFGLLGYYLTHPKDPNNRDVIKG